MLSLKVIIPLVILLSACQLDEAGSCQNNFDLVSFINYGNTGNSINNNIRVGMTLNDLKGILPASIFKDLTDESELDQILFTSKKTGKSITLQFIGGNELSEIIWLNSSDIDLSR